MKIVILHDGVKRELSGSFGILAHGHVLRRLVDAIESKRAGEEWGDMSYGWIEVHETVQSGPTNTEPLGWSE